MILIYSKDVDDFVNQVVDCIDNDFIRFSEFDRIVINSMEFCDNTSSYLICSEYVKSVDLEKIKCIWFNGGVISSFGDEYEDKCYEILNDSYLLQKEAYKIGTRLADFRFNRLDVMLEAKNQNLKIPHTLITSDKKKLLDFFNLHKYKNGIISKRILDNYFYQDEKYFYNFNLTFSITLDILEETPEDFALSFFQERIIADFEIRVIYLDEVFFSACIYNFNENIDYRTNLWNMNDIRIIPFKLPMETERKLKRIFKKFNINYGSADLMYYNGEYYFLEINPTGQISFINNACNYYIENIIAKKMRNNEDKTN